ncbi:MAG: phosphoglucosamine mutase [Verrucomicrobiota bacterium]
MSQNPAPTLFGTDGIRGPAHEYPLDLATVRKAGQAFAKLLREGGEEGPTVLLGRDTRESGPALTQALAEGLQAAGAQVISAGVLPTPAVAMGVPHQSLSGGIMVTASHNPFADNGLKFFGADGFKLPDEGEAALEALLHDPAFVEERAGGKELPDPGIRDHFVEQSVAAVGGAGALEGLRMVLDLAHGASVPVAEAIFTKAGAEVSVGQASPTGRNINQACGAMHPEWMAEAVLAEGADLGVALDGDADRALFADASGALVSGDRILGLAALALKKAGQLKQNALAVTVMSNLGLHAAMKAAGIAVEVTPVGDRHVVERMRARDLVLGGENSGHVIFLDQATTGDGIATALRLAVLMKESGQSLAELAAFMEEFPQCNLALEVARKTPLEQVPALLAAIQQAEKDLAPDGRVLVRYSGTEAKIRLLTEHASRERARAALERLERAVAETIGA